MWSTTLQVALEICCEYPDTYCEHLFLCRDHLLVGQICAQDSNMQVHERFEKLKEMMRQSNCRFVINRESRCRQVTYK